ncbi:MAG: outer membrane lipoprotein carrier protein LolA [Deltaproteobacteria bacterium]|nr:outer membrane lipoprotein carrier protein LolA [Deltaproteobacteria bacterium]
MILRCLLICILWIGLSPNTCFALEATDILHRVQQRYASGDFRADFLQESHLQAMGMVDTAKGQLLFGSPGTMRWHYQAPEEYFIITDGDTVWIYRPEDNQVIQGRAIDYFGGRKGSDFFSNPDELSKDFIVALAPKELQEEINHVLKLVPKREQPDLTELYLFVSRSTYDIVRTVTSNAFGDKTTIRFDNYRFKQGHDSSLFLFKIPDGAEVLNLQEEQGLLQP